MLPGVARTPKAARNSPRPVRRIEVLGYRSVQLLDGTGPLQLFATTNEIDRELCACTRFGVQASFEGDFRDRQDGMAAHRAMALGVQKEYVPIGVVSR